MRLASSLRPSRPHRTAAALACAVLGASLAVSAPAAHAENQTTTDMRTDVRETDQDGSNQVRKRGDKLRDVVWAKASYADNKIKLWIEVRELGSAGQYAVGWQLQDPTGGWTVQYNHEESTPVVSLSVLFGSEAPCANLRGERMPSKEQVKIVLPASCIGHPDWIRFGAAAIHRVGDTDRYRADDARRDNELVVPTLRLGGRIHEN